MRKQGNWNRDILESQSMLFKGVKVTEDRGGRRAALDPRRLRGLDE